jgi:hypothetical protein
MSGIFGTRSAKNVSDYASGYAYLALNDGDSASASTTAPYSFKLVGWTQGTKISNTTEVFEEKDDSGQIVVKRETVNSVMVEGTFLERTADVRNSVTAGGSTYYTLLIVGTTLDASGTPVKELWVFPKVTFSQTFEYEIGGKARMGYSLTCFAPDEAVDVLFDTVNHEVLADWSVNGITAVNKVVPANQFYVTTDEAFT